MYRIESIESILHYLAMNKPSCSIITSNDKASQQSADYPIVYHQWKRTE